MDGNHSPSAGSPPIPARARHPTSGSLAPCNPRAVPAGSCTVSRPRSGGWGGLLKPHALGPQSALPLPLRAPRGTGVPGRDTQGSVHPVATWRGGCGGTRPMQAGAGGGRGPARCLPTCELHRHTCAHWAVLPPVSRPRQGRPGGAAAAVAVSPPCPRLSALPCSPALSPPAPACSPRPPGSVLSELLVGWRRPRGTLPAQGQGGGAVLRISISGAKERAGKPRQEIDQNILNGYL